MITKLMDTDGKIVAYCEWRIVGPSGYETPNAEYIWINDIWVHKEFRNTHRVNRMIDEIMRICPDAKYGYFQRKNHNDRVRIYTRSQFERMRMVYDPLTTGDK